MYYSNVCAIPNIQGPRNDLFLRGALIKRKMRISLFPKFLLNKSPILREARAPLAPPGSAAPANIYYYQIEFLC